MKNFALSLLLLILLACRNDDFFISDNILNENHRQKFTIFTPKSPKDTIDYAKGFEILAKRYDSLYQTNFTGYKNLEKWKDNYPIPNHIDFTKHSQVITNDNGDKWMIFPKISNDKVSDLVIAYLVENETIVGFNTIDKNSDLFKLNISSFQKNYSSDNLISKNLNRTNSYRPIPEVVIVVPKPITFPTYPIFGGGHGEIENIPGSDSCKYSLCTPDEGGGGGSGGRYTPSPDKNNNPCDKSKNGQNTTNNIFQNPNVKQKMDNVLRNKIGSENEWAVAIGRNPNGSYSVSSPLEGSNSSGYIPDVPSGQYIADGHTHRNTGVPSGGDFYGMLQIITENSHYTTRFVYGEHFDKKEVYALVVVDRDLAKKFLEQYPRDRNYDEDNHNFNRNTSLGEDYHRMYEIGRDGYYNYNEVSKNNYSSRAIAMAYILEKYNTGLSLLKADKKGNFQAFRVSDADHNSFGGSKKAGAKLSNCP